MSSLEIRDLFSRPGLPAYPFIDSKGQLCWLESITEQGGRLALRQQTAGGARIVTPEGFQIRSGVHEYGGKCFCIVGDAIYFNNYADGLIYRQGLFDDDHPVAAIEAMPGVSGYADLVYLGSLQSIVAVQETRGERGGENLNQLVGFSASGAAPVAPQMLVRGADFYAAPCAPVSGDKLAWLQWNHPYMPWDACSLFQAKLVSEDESLFITDVQVVAGDADSSVCQPGFLSNGELLFAMDREPTDASSSVQAAENYWNLYLAGPSGSRPLTRQQAEYGEAHWVFGQQRWVQLDHATLLAVVTRDESDSLVLINLETLESEPVGEACARISQLFCLSGQAYCIAEYCDKPGEIIQVDVSGRVQVCVALESWLDAKDVSYPERVCFQTRDGAQAFANFYPACVRDKQAATALMVLVHGGPTARADTSLKPLVQYFAQNGFAVLDVNHRGSTGHGRAYRQALLGQWGEIDASDIVDAIGFICAHHGVDPAKVLIRGGSAGGYAVLRALTRYPEVFRGGACYYGIGNLITLAEITHKFEGRYTDRLIGEAYTPETAALEDSRFRSRSPIFEIERIQSPLILFQGLDDRVVPPEVSREIVRTLEARGLKHEYVEYAGEGHGFRKAETKIDSLQREIRFYRDILEQPVSA